MTILEHDPDWHGVVQYNAFAHTTELHKAFPGMQGDLRACRALCDTDVSHMTRNIQDDV